MKLLCDDRHPLDDFEWDHMLRCGKTAIRFFIRQDNASARGVPLKAKLCRCAVHSTGIFKNYFDEVSLEEYLVAEVMCE